MKSVRKAQWLLIILLALPTPTLAFSDSSLDDTPNRAILDTCVAKPFTTDDAAIKCTVAAARSCGHDTLNMTQCAEKISIYLDKAIRRRLYASGRMNTRKYHDWFDARSSICDKDFDPAGMGSKADIYFCMSYEMMRLLQKHLVRTQAPIWSLE